MIGRLPVTLNVNGKELNIRTDFRDCLVILSAFNDTELTDYEKCTILIECLYRETVEITDLQEAFEKGVWFLDGGKETENDLSRPKLYDLEQDEQIIFSAINKVAGKEIRSLDYMHFWTFLGLFNEIGEGTFSTVVSIRDKKRKGKKLEKWEQEFYRHNKEMVDLKKKHTKNEEEELNEVRKLLGIPLK